MVSMDDKSERDKKRQRPIGHTFLGHVSKASSEYSVTSGLFDLMSTNSNDRNGDRKMMRTMRKSRSPKRYNSNSKGSSSKHWQVKVPRRMVCTVAAIFLLLPMAIFTWKETHWHAEEHHAEEHAVKHIRKRNKRNAYPTWMEDAEKEASALLLNEQVNDGVVGVLDSNNAQKNSTVDITGNLLQSGADPKEGQHGKLLSENQSKAAAAVSKAESTNQTDSESDSKDEGEDTVEVPSDQTNKEDGSGESNQQKSAEDTDGEDSAGENNDKNEAPESPSEDGSVSGNAAAGDDAEEGSSAAQEAKAVGSSQQEDAIEDKVEDSEQVSNQESVEQQ